MASFPPKRAGISHLGFINIIKSGKQHLLLNTDETFNSIVSFRSGGRVLYGILGVGYNLKGEKHLFAFQAGLGAHLWSGNKLGADIQIIQLYLEDLKKGTDYSKSSLDILPRYSISKSIEIFAGPNLNYINTKNEGSNLVKNYLVKWENSDSNFDAIYIGGKLGVAWRF